MKLRNARLIADFSFSLDVIEDYNAPGGPTAAIQGDERGDLEAAVACFLRAVADADQDYEDCADVADILEALETDRLGMGWVWY